MLSLFSVPRIRPQLERLHARGQIEAALLRLHAQRLQDDRAAGAAEQRVGADAQPDRRLRTDPAVVAVQLTWAADWRLAPAPPTRSPSASWSRCRFRTWKPCRGNTHRAPVA